MRILLFLLFLGICLEAQAQQLIDFQLKQADPETALEHLRETSGLNIAYSPNFFPKGKVRDYNYRQLDIEEILKQILEGYALEYKILGRRILIFRAKPSTFTISGYIRDVSNQEHLIAATIYSSSLQNGTTTNEYGFFSISLPKGPIELEFRYIGYEPMVKKFDLSQDLRLDVALQPAPMLQEVLVITNRDSHQLYDDLAGASHQINPQLLDAVPGLGGEPDVIRSAQLIAGIQGGTDGLGGTQVRGGDNGHNLMLLDGVPVYIPFHLMGALSIYNAQTVQSARVLKGNFSARYGGRLSSVFDVRMREGNRLRWQGQVGANLLSTQAVIEGPILKEKGSLLIAGRYAPLDFLLRPTLSRLFFRTDQDDIGFDFHDYNVKLNYSLGKRDRLFFSFFNGQDNFGGYNELFDETEVFEFDLNWRNTTSALRWNHIYGSKLFSNLTLTNSIYEFNYSSLSQYEFEDEEEEIVDGLFFYGNASRNEDWALKFDLDYLPSLHHRLRFGAGISLKTFAPEVAVFDEEEDFIEELDTFNTDEFEAFYDIQYFHAVEGFLYAEDDWQINPVLQLNLGARLSAFNQDFDTYLRLEPRISLKYQPLAGFQLNASFGRMVQYLHLISSSALRLPNDIWLPSTSNILPQSSLQYELGFRLELPRQMIFSMDAYYKDLDNLYAYPDLGLLAIEVDEDLSEELIRGSGESYGIEWTLQKKGRQSGAWINYTLAWSNRQFADLNQGKSFPYVFDQRHQFKSFFYYNFLPGWQLSANFVYNSPAPQTGFLSFTEGFEDDLVYDPNDEGKRNELRSPAFHRLDLNLSYQLTGERFSHQFKIGAYNLYGRRNVAFYNFTLTEDPNFLNQQAVWSMPFLPSFSYNFKW